MGIMENATKVLQRMANYEAEPGDPKKGHYEFHAKELPDLTGLQPQEINDAADILENQGYLKTMRYLGTHPFTFGVIELTPRGRLEAERINSANEAAQSAARSPGFTQPATVASTPLPVGSPYGFTAQDWESVSLDHNSPAKLIVVFGYQWQSKFYDEPKLTQNVKGMFELALTSSLQRLGFTCELNFRALQAGYGTHLFNRIVRDIISADIAIFDTSDLNPNVMIEMGVALTWGVRVLPIRNRDAPKPPSDISGHTWAEYTDSGAVWTDTEHSRKLEEMVTLAVRRKPTPTFAQADNQTRYSAPSPQNSTLLSLHTELVAFIQRAELDWEIEESKKPSRPDGFLELGKNLLNFLKVFYSKLPQGHSPDGRLRDLPQRMKKMIMELDSLVNSPGIGDSEFMDLLLQIPDTLKALKALSDELLEVAST